MTHKVRTCLWFNGGGVEAARLYVSLLPDSQIETALSPDPSKPPLVIDFTLAGTPYQILDAGPNFPQSECVSISVTTVDQVETDRLWTALTANGGSESNCGWLKDRFGVSWQIVPQALMRCLSSSDRAAAGRAMEAMMTMNKIDIAAIQAAFG